MIHDLASDAFRRVLLLLVHHTAAVGAVLMTVDPEAIVSAEALPVLGSLIQGVPLEEVAQRCGDEEMARRLRWMAGLPAAAASADPAAEVRGLLPVLARDRAEMRARLEVAERRAGERWASLVRRGVVR